MDCLTLTTAFRSQPHGTQNSVPKLNALKTGPSPIQKGAGTSLPQHLLRFIGFVLPSKAAQNAGETIRLLHNTRYKNIKCNISK